VYDIVNINTKNLVLTALKIANFIIRCTDILISAVSLSDLRHTSVTSSTGDSARNEKQIFRLRH